MSAVEQNGTTQKGIARKTQAVRSSAFKHGQTSEVKRTIFELQL